MRVVVTCEQNQSRTADHSRFKSKSQAANWWMTHHFILFKLGEDDFRDFVLAGWASRSPVTSYLPQSAPKKSERNRILC